ncbi:para-nitrobenzyl esterase isoform X1 [Leptinotarsa decemlineata]|uniref:para-nitrobenzyl esterase isoform X1 n=1 Tax=Leptinotarsa decemlineata TaxID=7539 RepID=UPI003D30D146
MVHSQVVRFLFCQFHFLNSLYETSANVEVKISDGHIRGRQLLTERKTPYFAFQDIPYAKPPVGDLRFKEPVKPEKWEGVLNTTENRKVCIQFSDPSDPRETEDCLVLNVYTPVNSEKLGTHELAVLVWIHGGSFRRWFGAMDSFGPDYFIDKNVIVVTLNYRLGPLGFLTTNDGVIPANNGLKDQHLALKWVNENIEVFGGDPAKVTIAGQSAGAASVGYHVMSKKSAGLFRAAIMQSACPLTCWSLQKYPEDAAKLLGSNLKWNSRVLSKLLSATKNISSDDLLKKLQSASIADLKKYSDINLQVPLSKKNCHAFTSLTWTPVIENEEDENALVTGMSHENIKEGNINRVPVLMGINSEESLLFGAQNIQLQCSLFDPSLKSMITGNLRMKEGNKRPAGYSIKNLYTESLFSMDRAASVNLISDMVFAIPTARHAHLQSNYTDVYFYKFSHLGKLGRLVNETVPGAEGVAHQEEIEYLFRSSNNRDMSKFPEEDRITHDRLVTMWSQFVKHLNPTKGKNELLQNIVWPKVTPQDFFYLDINTTLAVAKDLKNFRQYEKIYSSYAEEKLFTY